MTSPDASAKPAVCLVAISLGTGGSDRSCAHLSQLLAAAGYDTHVAVLNDTVNFEYGGSLLNLGTSKKGRDHIFKRLQRMRRLKRYLKSHKIEYVIDHRAKNNFYREWFYKKFVYRSVKTIYVVHSHLLKTYFGATPSRFKAIYQTNAATVAVSEAIKTSLQEHLQLRNVVHIPNAVNPQWETAAEALPELPVDTPYLLSYGRLNDSVKDLKFLLKSYAYSKLAASDVSLVLLGDGPSLPMLKQWVKTHELEQNIHFITATPNPFPYVKNALAVTLTSHFEGFPMVLLEALYLKVPVVSLDIPSGPSELVKHQQNGLLIKKREVSLFAEALRKIALDDSLRQALKEQTKTSVEKYHPEHVTALWEKLLTHEHHQS